MSVLGLAFDDTTNAHLLESDGSYRPVLPKRGEPAVRSQLELQEQARERAPDTSASNQKEFEVRRKAGDA